MGEEVSVEITKDGDAVVASFNATSISGTEGIQSAGRAIRDFVGENRPRKVVFDFERVKFFSSQVLGLLVEVRAKLQEYDGVVVISGINPQLHRVFRITNLDKLFRFFPDRNSAVEGDEQESS
jgi:anti-anti-sigma factor